MAQRARNRSRRSRRTHPTGKLKGWVLFGLSAAIVLFIGGELYKQLSGRVALADDLCPVQGEDSVTVVLVDLTDPLTVPQRQDLTNQLEAVRNSVPKHGRLTLYKVAATNQQLL